MKKYASIIALLTIVMLTAINTNGKDQVPAHPGNCFWGYVYLKQNGNNVPVQGATVELFYQLPTVPPAWESLATCQTSGQGEYWFSRPLGGWTPGIYLIKTGCCEKEVNRLGDGDIQVNFYEPCPCHGPSIPKEPADQQSVPIGEP